MPTVVQWVNHLTQKIEKQRRYAAPFELRYRNEYVLPFIAREYREVYGARADGLLGVTLQAPRVGAARNVVNALTERLTVLGGTSEDEATSKALQAAWEDSDLDVMHREAHRENFVRSLAFGAASRSTDGRAIATIESSEQAAVHRMKAPPYDVDAYLKLWSDEWTGEKRGLLQIEGRDVHIEQDDKVTFDPEGSGQTWRWRIVKDEVRPGLPPVVEFAQSARLLEEPQSEIETAQTLIDLKDLIEGLMVFAGHFGAVPIRYATGFDIPRDPKDPSKPLLGKDGKPMVGFNPRADHLWLGSEKTQFGQLTPATLDTFIAWSQHADVLLRTHTRIASTYFGMDVKSHMSAELLKVDEAPMVRRINDMGKRGTLNGAWRRLMTHMMRMEGHLGRVTPLWEDPQTRVEAQAVDAFIKAAPLVGTVAAAEAYLGWTRERAERAIEEAAAEQQARLDAQVSAATSAAPDPFSLLPVETQARLKAVPDVDAADASAGA